MITQYCPADKSLCKQIAAMLKKGPIKRILRMHRNTKKNLVGNRLSPQLPATITAAAADESLELPDGALDSELLDDQMIRELMVILPPKAICYPWIRLYSSSMHGFSLATLYRKMAEGAEVCQGSSSPVLLVVQDMDQRVFGAVISSISGPSREKAFSGTGDSCLLFRFTNLDNTKIRNNTGSSKLLELEVYRWTSKNDHFVYAGTEFLCIGAGGDGHFGLWLDDGLSGGCSQKCATFDNEPLAGGPGGQERFLIKSVEAFSFGHIY